LRKIILQSLLYFILVCASCMPGEAFSQKGYFPFLAGDKYGIADENMKIITPAIYMDVITVMDGYLSLVRQDTGWDVIGKHGETLIKKAFVGDVTQNSKGSTGISIRHAYFQGNIAAEGKFAKVSLFAIVDPFHRIQYYINPNAPPTKYTPFVYNPKPGMDSGSESIPDPVHTGIIRVVMPDSKINFIDTTGNTLFKYSVLDGDVYGSNVIGVRSDQSGIRIYNKNQDLLSDFSYEDVSSSQNGLFIHCKRKVTTNETKMFIYDLFDTHGMPLLKDRFRRTYTTQSIIFDNDDSGGYLYSLAGELIKTFPACTLVYNYVNPEMPFIIKDHKIGLINSKGQYIVESNYKFLSPIRENLTYFTKGNTSGIMDESFQEMWQIDSIGIVGEFPNKPGYYLIEELNSGASLYGLADSLGNVIFPPFFSSLSYIRSWDIIVGTRDSLSAIYSLRGEYIFPLAKINYDFDLGEIKVWESDSVKVYDRSFHMVHSWDRVREELRPYKENGAYGLQNVHGQVVTKPLYKEIYRRMQEMVTNKSGYLAWWIEVEGDSADLLNQYGQSIVPAGYVFYISKAQDGKGTVMPFIVTNQEDIKRNLWMPRKGLIDLNGQWVIKPDYQEVHIIGNKIIVTTNEKTLERHFHDQFGNVINKKPYQYFNSNADEGIFHDRIRIGYALTDSIQSEGLSLQMMPTGLRNGAIKSGRFKEPVYRIGAMDTKGHVIIPCKYVEMDDFIYSYTCVKGLNENGQIYNAVIDVNDKILLKTDHDLMRVFLEDSTLLCFQKNAKKGVLTLSGEVLVKPLYEDIEIRNELGHILVEDSLYMYLIPYQRPSEIYKLGEARYFNRDKFGQDGLVFTFTESSSGQKLYRSSFFDKDLNLIRQMTAYYISSDYPGWYVPDHFVVVEDSKGAKKYLMNVLTGQKYKRD